MTLREAAITFILLGVTIYLLLVDIFVVPVVNEKCVQETGRTCAEAVEGKEGSDEKNQDGQWRYPHRAPLSEARIP